MDEKNPALNLKPEFVGRQGEINKLCDIFNDIEKKDISTIFISGEAGIGKTRLIEEFEEQIREDVYILKGKCLNESMEPLLPVREAFRKSDLQHLISEDPPPKVISTYLIDDTGLLISKSEREESDLDGDIFAPMLETIESFVKDSLSEMGRKDESGKGLNTIGYGKYNILIQSGERFSLAAIIEGTKTEFLIEDMNEKLNKAESKLKSWEGDVEKADKVEDYISWFIDTNKYKGEYLVDDPEIKQENLFENIMLGLKRLSSENPVIIFIDDLQWADSTTLLLLHFLSRNVREDRILILGTYRPEDIITQEDGKEHGVKSRDSDI